MKVLITAPNLDDSKQVGGIITVINTIASVITVPYDIFIRSPSVEQRNLWGRIGWVRRIFAYAQLCFSGQYDIVHVHTAMNRSALLRDAIWVYIGSWSHAKILLHVHGGKYLFEKPGSRLTSLLIGEIFKNSNAVIVLSETEKKSIVDLYHVSKPIYVLGNAINTDVISAAIAKLGPIENSNLVRLIFIGRITESKGIHDIVEAIEQLSQATSKFRFDLYGDGELKDYVVDKLYPLLGERFQYHGIVSGSAKWKALQESDVFLLPSRYGEGLPMALLEAMFLGKIPVTSDDASIGLVVKHNVNGFLVKKRDPVDLKNTLLEIVNSDFDRFKLLSIAAKSTVSDKYVASKYIVSLQSIYANLI